MSPGHNTSEMLVVLLLFHKFLDILHSILRIPHDLLVDLHRHLPDNNDAAQSTQVLLFAAGPPLLRLDLEHAVGQVVVDVPAADLRRLLERRDEERAPLVVGLEDHIWLKGTVHQP